MNLSLEYDSISIKKFSIKKVLSIIIMLLMSQSSFSNGFSLSRNIQSLTTHTATHNLKELLSRNPTFEYNSFDFQDYSIPITNSLRAKDGLNLRSQNTSFFQQAKSIEPRHFIQLGTGQNSLGMIEMLSSIHIERSVVFDINDPLSEIPSIFLNIYVSILKNEASDHSISSMKELLNLKSNTISSIYKNFLILSETNIFNKDLLPRNKDHLQSLISIRDISAETDNGTVFGQRTSINLSDLIQFLHRNNITKPSDIDSLIVNLISEIKLVYF